MKKTFLISALPRSRTAWLSSLLTFGPVACLHDIGHRYEDLDGVLSEMFTLPVPVVGYASPGCGHVLSMDREHARAMGTKLIEIRRPWKYCADSFALATNTDFLDWRKPIEEASKQLEAQAEWADLVLEYSDLEKEDACRKLWEVASNGEPFPQLHWERMRTLQVEVHSARMKAAARGLPLPFEPEDKL